MLLLLGNVKKLNYIVQTHTELARGNLMLQKISYSEMLKKDRKNLIAKKYSAGVFEQFELKALMIKF